MELLLLLGFIFFLIYLLTRSPKSNKSGRGAGPIVMRSNNGYEGHLDFLEMHGFISPEERQAQRDFEKDFKENPQNYKVTTLEELFKEMDEKKKPKP